MPPWHWWRTVFYLIPAITLYTVVLGLASLLSTLVDRRGHAADRCARLWSRWILQTTGVRVRVQGEPLSPDARSCVFVCNHQSTYDIPVVFATLPARLRILAKASLGHVPFLGWHLRRSGHVLVDRSNPGPSVMGKMEDLVRDGASLIVFPEGTRSADGQVGRFKAGAFVTAVDHHLPLVPITIDGIRAVMPKGRLMTCPGEVTLTVHPAISTDGLTRDDVRALMTQVHDTMRVHGSSVHGSAVREP
ncbi:MAG: lysophospholipid acyltransferase family protein [Acidobacteria bacterium]|nr:lysophospholipid acyltransferase family protein [Acidobacteriota bacterium]